MAGLGHTGQTNSRVALQVVSTFSGLNVAFPKEGICGEKPPSAGTRWLFWVSLPDQNRWEGGDSPGTSSTSHLPADAYSIRWELDRRTPQNLPSPNGRCCASTSRVRSNPARHPKGLCYPKIRAVIQGCDPTLMLVVGLQNSRDGFGQGVSQCAGWHSAHPPVPRRT